MSPIVSGRRPDRLYSAGGSYLVLNSAEYWPLVPTIPPLAGSHNLILISLHGCRRCLESPISKVLDNVGFPINEPSMTLRAHP